MDFHTFDFKGHLEGARNARLTARARTSVHGHPLVIILLRGQLQLANSDARERLCRRGEAQKIILQKKKRKKRVTKTLKKKTNLDDD